MPTVQISWTPSLAHQGNSVWRQTPWEMFSISMVIAGAAQMTLTVRELSHLCLARLRRSAWRSTTTAMRSFTRKESGPNRSTLTRQVGKTGSKECRVRPQRSAWPSTAMVGPSPTKTEFGPEPATSTGRPNSTGWTAGPGHSAWLSTRADTRSPIETSHGPHQRASTTRTRSSLSPALISDSASRLTQRGMSSRHAEQGSTACSQPVPGHERG